MNDSECKELGRLSAVGLNHLRKGDCPALSEIQQAYIYEGNKDHPKWVPFSLILTSCSHTRQKRLASSVFRLVGLCWDPRQVAILCTCPVVICV